MGQSPGGIEMLELAGFSCSVLPMNTATIATLIIVGATSGIVGFMFFLDWIQS